MHLAPSYISSVLGTHRDVKNFSLSVVHANKLRELLVQDSKSYMFNGLVSYFESANSATTGSFSWSTVKAYYSTFYLLRSLLSIWGSCIAYDIHSKKYWQWEAIAQNPPTRLEGSTHGSVCKLFKIHTLSRNLVQDIDNENFIDWLKIKREDANYKNGTFPEPICPNHFATIKNSGIKSIVEAYVADSTFTYTYSRDHCILAYPIEIWRTIISTFAEDEPLPNFFSTEQKDFLNILANQQIQSNVLNSFFRI